MTLPSLRPSLLPSIPNAVALSQKKKRNNFSSLSVSNLRHSKKGIPSSKPKNEPRQASSQASTLGKYRKKALFRSAEKERLHEKAVFLILVPLSYILDFFFFGFGERKTLSTSIYGYS